MNITKARKVADTVESTTWTDYDRRDAFARLDRSVATNKDDRPKAQKIWNYYGSKDRKGLVA